jgi:hypothetical protein
LESESDSYNNRIGISNGQNKGEQGLIRAALPQMEAGEKRLRKTTLGKLAAAIGIGVEKLR